MEIRSLSQVKKESSDKKGEQIFRVGVVKYAKQVVK